MPRWQPRRHIAVPWRVWPRLDSKVGRSDNAVRCIPLEVIYCTYIQWSYIPCSLGMTGRVIGHTFFSS
jgi:hypothetical protein